MKTLRYTAIFLLTQLAGILSFFIMPDISKLPLLNSKFESIITATTHKKLEKTAWEKYLPDENPFKNWTKSDISALFNVHIEHKEPTFSFSLEVLDHAEEAPLPDAYDSRAKFPACTRTPRAQGHCGSCWALSISSVLSDRFCIASEGKLKPELSPQDFVSCDTENQGCHAGNEKLAWKYLEEQGLVTEQCFKYNSTYDFVPECRIKCETNEEFVKYKVVKDSTKKLACPHEIQHEILNNGPVAAGFIVAEDFMHYKGGVYHYETGELMGGHAIKIVGWGKEQDVSFWIVENSWGPEWGEKGYFRIKFGELLIDSNAYAGQADLSSVNTNKHLRSLRVR